jgi:hypothetical protein
MVKFFVPAAESPEQAEIVYSRIADFNNAPIPNRRIYALAWRHNGMNISCEVGGPLPSYYRTGDEPVLAILDCDTLYKVCTPSRGGVRGEAVFAGKNFDTVATYFD